MTSVAKMASGCVRKAPSYSETKKMEKKARALAVSYAVYMFKTARDSQSPTKTAFGKLAYALANGDTLMTALKKAMPRATAEKRAAAAFRFLGLVKKAAGFGERWDSAMSRAGQRWNNAWSNAQVRPDVQAKLKGLAQPVGNALTSAAAAPGQAYRAGMSAVNSGADAVGSASRAGMDAVGGAVASAVKAPGRLYNAASNMVDANSSPIHRPSLSPQFQQPTDAAMPQAQAQAPSKPALAPDAQAFASLPAWVQLEYQRRYGNNPQYGQTAQRELVRRWLASTQPQRQTWTAAGQARYPALASN